jgi:hypothetical protein
VWGVTGCPCLCLSHTTATLAHATDIDREGTRPAFVISCQSHVATVLCKQRNRSLEKKPSNGAPAQSTLPSKQPGLQDARSSDTPRADVAAFP